MNSDTPDTAQSNKKSESDDTAMVHLSVRVPKQIADEVETVWSDRGFASRSEFLRSAIREAVYPPARLSTEAREAIAASQQDIARGRTIDLDDIE
ncbi:MAG: ribbon-helix-helix domain-containing protein [Halobacteriales archaeon]